MGITVNRSTVLTATIAVSLVLSACGSDPEDTTNAVAPATEAPPETNPALDFEAETTWGEAFDGESLDQESAVLWFWSTDCDECVRQAPQVLAAAANHSDITFHGVAGRDELEQLQDFEMTHGLDAMTSINDADGLIWAGFGVISPPTMAFIRPDGTHTTVSGAMTEHELEVAISEELG